ncbi:hypothetical protein C1645_828979 [Glomus cerebriforme]|uniref:Uncharacterized protein n=1 Tax=Glomus cerebriforme TaxID=658196 RepID=A0A397SKC5_9GLOM|nr:hypothetical protein C1645_828979 [Glomus cerebriforme]
MLVEFNKKAPKFYNSENVPVLKIRALDEGNISRDPYQCLCAIEPHLPHEGAVSKELDQSEEVDIEDEAIVQGVIDAIGKGGYRNIKDILQYLVSDLVHKRILNPYNPTIHL